MITTNGRTAGAIIPLAGLYENTSQRTGKTYFSGYLGKAKVLLLQNDRAEEGQPGWTLFLAERSQKPARGGDGR